jgi:hypothetical protein
MADDDPDDRKLTQEAFEENHLTNELRFVEDGEELLDYLKTPGKTQKSGVGSQAWNHPPRPKHAA